MELLARVDRAALRALCERCFVEHLDMFGSVTTAAFDPERSDVDVLVRFGPRPRGRYFDVYLQLRDGLEALFFRPVDLIEEGGMRNPYFIQSVQRSRQALYRHG